VIHEPHTIDEHDFGEDCPECAPLCADALNELSRWLIENPTPKAILARVSALVVQQEIWTVREAQRATQLNSKQTIYNAKKSMSEHFEMKYKHGKVL
jgi:hypothetical protein